MTGLNFKQMVEKEQVKDLQKLEKEFPKIQGFLYNSKKNTLIKLGSKERIGMSSMGMSIEPYAEKLVEEIKNV